MTSLAETCALQAAEQCAFQARRLYALVADRHPESPREIRLSTRDAAEIYAALSRAAEALRGTGK